jgi:hypothetical protein
MLEVQEVLVEMLEFIERGDPLAPHDLHTTSPISVPPHAMR